MTILTIAFAILTIKKTILETCDIWDTDYNSDNWEPEFMTIFVTSQLIVTLDSIRNSCDICICIKWLATNSSSYLAISFLPDSFPHIKATLRGANEKTPWKFVQFTKGICLKLKIYLSKVKNVHLFQIQICLMLLIVARLILFGLKQYCMPCYCWSQGQQLWKGKIMKMIMVVVAR